MVYTTDIMSRNASHDKYGGLAERFKAAVLKTVEVKASAGSNPVSSAIAKKPDNLRFFSLY